MALVFAVVNLFVDVLYAFIDPRIRVQYEGTAKRGKGGLLSVRKRA
jgi:peptide/nickel transport system permease protein